MPVDRKLASAPLTDANTPQWRCPTCNAGHFRLLDDSLKHELEGPLQLVWHEEWFDADHAKYRFSALLRCTNDACKEVASVAGWGDAWEYEDYELNERCIQERFYPTYFNPSPPLVEIPHGCPEDVGVQLRRAFTASWDEPGAAAGRVRIATELLLTHLKVRKTLAKRGGGRARLNLHTRIEALPAKHAEVREALLAIKWLGNAGAHEAEMSRDTVYDAFDIIELILRKLFSKEHVAVERLVKAVNKRKGPAARRKTADR